MGIFNMKLFKKKVEFFDCVDGDYTSSWIIRKKINLWKFLKMLYYDSC